MYEEFQQTVWDYYHDNSRDLPWRLPEQDGSFSPYKILISEIMLQQTQAARVIPKYHQFLEQFPDVSTLAEAPLSSVLTAWSGLGYNRRAKFLWEAARMIVVEYGSTFPDSLDQLVKLPGVGKNTAGAICAYAFNQPVVFIETNIRSVYIQHFFEDEREVSDSKLEPLVAATVDIETPREWYWALMDYGVHIKSTIGNTSRNSKHYTKQSTFKGSRREIRGMVIKYLTESHRTKAELMTYISDERLTAVLEDLVTEKLIKRNSDTYSL